MKQNKQWKFLFLIVLSVLMLLTACAKKQESTDGETNNQESNLPTVSEDLKIAENGIVNFKLVYASDTTDDVKESISSLRQALITRSNNGMVLVSEADSSEYQPDVPEILIGNTGYAESNAVMTRIGYGDWTVCVEENKIVIAAYSRQALRSAITKTIQTIKNGADDTGTIVVPSDLNLVGTQDEIINNLPRYDGENASSAQTIEEGNDTSIAVIKRSTVAEYEQYLAKLTTNGYTLHASNTICENRFYTYINDSYLIHAGWYDYENAARITIEPKTALLGLESDNVWQPNENVVTSLAQMGLRNEGNQYADGGMGYILQLADVSFVVMDGGFYSNADQIYEYMKAKAPNGKIVIAVWLISHQDTDHCKAFVTFSGRYGSEVQMEYLIVNFPSAFLCSEVGHELEVSVLSAAKTLDGCKIIKAHTGMKLFLRNAEIEILFTLDAKVPESIINPNNCSLVYQVKVEGETLLFCGDMADDAARILVSMYGEYLKSDFVQISHHGLTNGSGREPTNVVQFYRYACAEVVLWPCSEERYLNTDGDASRDIANFGMNQAAMESARETWIAGGERITVFELPYTNFSAYRFDPINPNPPSVAGNPSSSFERIPFIGAVGDAGIVHIKWSDGK